LMFAEPCVEPLWVDHTDKAVVDGHVDRARARREDARARCPRDEQRVRDLELAHEHGRNRPAAGLEAARAVEQQHRPAWQGKTLRCGGAGGSAAHDNGIAGLHLMHVSPPYSRPQRLAPAAWVWD